MHVPRGQRWPGTDHAALGCCCEGVRSVEAGEIEATAMQHLPRMAVPGIVAVVKFLTTDSRSENTPGLNFAQDGGDLGHRDARSGVRRPPPRTWRLANAGDGRRRCRRRAIAGCLPARDPGSDPLGRSQISPLVPCGPDRLGRRAQDIRLHGLQPSCRCARRKRRSAHRHSTFARTYAVVTQGTGGCQVIGGGLLRERG